MSWGHLDEFFEDVEATKDVLSELETIYGQLQSSHEKSKTLRNAKSVDCLRAKMENDAASAFKKVKFIKARLDSLDQANASSRKLPGCGPGSSSDRTRTSAVNSLRNKLHESIHQFNELQEKCLQTVQRRYYTDTGENANESRFQNLISTGFNFAAAALQCVAAVHIHKAAELQSRPLPQQWNEDPYLLDCYQDPNLNNGNQYPNLNYANRGPRLHNANRDPCIRISNRGPCLNNGNQGSCISPCKQDPCLSNGNQSSPPIRNCNTYPCIRN